jgi:uncharacterized protein RhaS with RHS repeats
MASSKDRRYTVHYRYGADGERALKYTQETGKESLYFNSMWQLNLAAGEWRQSKHVYAGTARLVTKNSAPGNSNTRDEMNGAYYHSDHLGSAQLITNHAGAVYERFEYTPYGEVWIEWANGGVVHNETLPFRFTGKELDSQFAIANILITSARTRTEGTPEETGLYYYGARYLDPKVSRWLSADPAMGDYIPEAPVNDEVKKRNQNLPGGGGIFNLVNLHTYHYAGNNPLKYTDPDGKEVSFESDAGATDYDKIRAEELAQVIENSKTDAGEMYKALKDSDKSITINQ